jgi:hypothetical protein
MTLYFRRYKIRNPLKPHSMGYLEVILAAEAVERKKKERTEKRKEEHRVMIPLQSHLSTNKPNATQLRSLAKLEGRKRSWQRAIEWARSVPHHIRFILGSSLNEPDEITQEDTEESESEKEWEGDWTAVLEADERT